MSWVEWQPVRKHLFSFTSTKIVAEAVCKFPLVSSLLILLHSVCLPPCMVTILSLLRIDLTVYIELFICEAFMQFSNAYDKIINSWWGPI